MLFRPVPSSEKGSSYIEGEEPFARVSPSEINKAGH